ncbi:aminodeoxychorismate synthase component I [Paenochrobactrum pullorum]|uniref:aminodeoxychorismate synthase component I n=1 Tax=Paenochrobactrum pullorum TaxID=1324351 RepID=UPI0035BBCFD1
MINDAVILFADEKKGREMSFAAPLYIIEANEPHAFEAAFQACQQAHDDGLWLAGFLSYEAGYLLEPQLRKSLPEGRKAPLLSFGVFEKPVEAPLAQNDAAARIYNFQPQWNLDEYRQNFNKLQSHLRAGDCYQGNLTFPIKAQWEGDPYALFLALAKRQQVGHASYCNFGASSRVPIILSRSPELFFEVDKDGWIETHPMKGTSPRGKTPEEDDYWRDFLKNDPKNQTENRMIVDLLRNDISLISETGTLHVPELFAVQRFETVHQMISRVRARLKPDLSLGAIFAALFPCGSITGAPKISVMRILQGLERTPRDIYCGSLGWIAPSGEMRFNVAIRTISLFDGGQAILNVGGGVILDSTAEEEYAECLLKARYATDHQPLK